MSKRACILNHNELLMLAETHERSLRHAHDMLVILQTEGRISDFIRLFQDLQNEMTWVGKWIENQSVKMHYPKKNGSHKF